MKDDKLYLIHILECIERIQQYTANGSIEFFGDTKTQDAVMRNLHTLAESTQRISEKLKNENPHVNWRDIAAFRNVIVHDYLGIDSKRIWDIVEKDLSDLKTQIITLLDKLGFRAAN